MTLDLKQLTQIQINRELNEVTEGFKEAIDGQFTPLKINTDQTANGVSENIRISAVQGGCFVAGVDPQNGKMTLSIQNIPYVGILYYEFKNCHINTAITFDYGFVGDDIVVRVFMNTERDFELSNIITRDVCIRNGFVNLPIWRNMSVSVKQMEIGKNELGNTFGTLSISKE